MRSRSIVIQGLIAFAAAAFANVIAIPLIASKELRIDLLVLSVITILYVVAVLINFDDRKSERQHEAELLKRTRVFWIEPFLDRLTDGPHWLRIEKAWLTRDHSNPKRTRREILTQDTTVSDIFTEAKGSLVMLGAPGSGKTITMLLLAKALVEAAEDHKKIEGQRKPSIPVVLNLSSWENQHESFFKWLQSELREKYFIPERIGHQLLDRNRLLLLLDGLDEVSDRHRHSCVRAIHDFIRRPSNTPTEVVVSCRLEEYLGLREKLRLKELRLEALDENEVRQYLERSSDQWAEIKEALEGNETFDQISRSPLMLNFIRGIYQDGPSRVVPPMWPTRIEECEELVIDSYIDTRLARLTVSDKEANEWVSWLAGRMSERSQSVFLPEQLQPSWLSSFAQRLSYVFGSRVASSMIVVLIGVLLMKLASGVSSLMWIGEVKPQYAPIGLIDVQNGLWSWVVITGGLGGLAFGTIDLILLTFRGSEVASEHISPGQRIKSFSVAVVNIVVCWLVFFGAAAWRFNTSKGLYGGMIYGVTFGLVFWFRGRQQTFGSDIKTADRLAWSWRGLPRGLGWGLVAGLLIGLVAGITVALISGVVAGGYVGGLACVAGVLVGGLLGVLEKVSIGNRKTSPNQGIRMSILNTFWVFIYVGLVCVLLFWLVGILLTHSPRIVFESAMFFGLVVGMLVAFSYAGLDVIYHYVLRMTLALAQNAPFRYVSFLDQAADLGLLTRVGGAYLFYHPKVKERLTSRDERSKTGKSRRKPRGNRARRKEALPRFGSLIASL